MVTEWGAAATVRGRKTAVAMIELDGPRLDPADGGAAQALVVMLHGVGADGHDLIGIAPLWAQLRPGVAFVSPNAPQPRAMAPCGQIGTGSCTAEADQNLVSTGVAEPLKQN